jgi:hypothetical protein
LPIVRGRGKRRGARQRRSYRLFVEPLEDRTLLAASISGTVVNDLNSNGLRDSGEPGVQAATVYLDLNGNGKLDTQDVFSGSTTFTAISSGPLANSPPYFAAVANVSGVSAQFSHISVSLSIARTSGGPTLLDVALISPQGLVDPVQGPSGPDLLHLTAGQGFNGTLDDSGAGGTTRPVQAFSLKSADIYGLDPTGQWELLLADANTGAPVSPSAVALTSWSIAFAGPEPTTQTAADGSYSFSGLAPGTYAVGVSGTAAPHDPTRTVTVVAGQTTTGADIAILPKPGSISGKVYNDLNSNGKRDTGEPTVQAATVYLDLNGDGKRDSAPVTVTGSTVFNAITGGPLANSPPYFAAVANVSGVSAQFSHISVNLNIARSPGGPTLLDVALISPQGLVDQVLGPSGPDLVHLSAGQGFNGTLDDSGAAGTTRPVQAFSLASADIYGLDPTGQWELLLADANTGAPVSPNAVALTGWSITFTEPEPTIQTAADGSYSFGGLAPGTYTVSVSGTAAAHDATRTVTVLTGQTTSGTDIGIAPSPGSISGTVYNDLNSNGKRDAGEPGVASATVYLDLNGDGKRGSAPVTVTGSTVFNAITGGPLANSPPYFAAVANVSGVSTQFSHISVSLNIARTSGGPTLLDVALISPQGLLDPLQGPSGPDLLHLGIGQGFNGTLDDSGAAGTSRPVQAFSLTSADIYGLDPTGQWELLLADANTGAPVSPSAVVLTSWSITFTEPEPTVQTAADGSYSFPGLAPGTYTVAVAGTAATHDPTHTVTVLTGQTTTGADIATNPSPGAISGTVYNDLNSDGRRENGEPGVQAATVYLDLNGDGRRDSAPVTFNGSTIFNAITGGPLANSPPYFAAVANVSGVSAQFSHISVSLDIVRTSGGPTLLDVALISPQGLLDPVLGPSGPDLVHLGAGQGFNGTLDDSGAAGTTKPVQAFSLTSADIFGLNPTGQWELLLADANTGAPVSPSAVNLIGWSITFTAPEPTVQTAADGSYSFTGLAPGTYTVGVSGTEALRDPTRTVTVVTGQTTTGADIGITPNPGAISGTLTNSQNGKALSNATVYLDLRGDGRLDPGDPTTQTDANGNYTFPGLVPGAYTVGVAGVAAGADPTRSVTVITAQTTVANLSVKAAPDLVGTSFQVAGGFATFGQTVTVNYTIANNGPGDAGAFSVELHLSTTSDVTTAGPLAGSFTVDVSGALGLAAGASTSGSLTVTLPGSVDSPPAGFSDSGPIYLGMVVDPANAAGDRNTANNSNQGLGIDTALLSNAPLTTGSAAQQQPSITVDPQNPKHLVVAYMDYSLAQPGYAGIGVQSSTNGGLTWQTSSVPLPAGFSQAAGYPVVAFDGQGHVYVSFMAATFLGPQPPVIFPDGRDTSGTLFRSYGMQANNGIFLSSSSDGGVTWGTPIAVASHTYTPGGTQVPFDTIPDLAIDRSALLPNGQPNPNYGRIYVTWTRWYPAGQFPSPSGVANGGSDTLIGVSQNGGAAWSYVILRTNSDATSPPGGGQANLSHVTVGPEGNVYFSLYSGGAFEVWSSSDGGRHFSGPDLPFGTSLSVFPSSVPLNDNFRTFPVRDIAADPTRPGTLYALEVVEVTNLNFDGRVIDGAEVEFTRSTDGGQTWSTPVTLNDDDGGKSLAQATSLANEVISGQALPHMTVDNAGNIAVIWYDTRRDPTNHNLDVFGLSSTDGGQTFTANYRVSNASFDPSAGRFLAGSNDFSLGDGIGLAAVDDTAYAVWTDTRNGNQDIYFASYPVAPPPRPLDDRFEPNGTPQTATPILASVPAVYPRLALTPGDVDWYRLTAVATGNLSVGVSSGGSALPQIVTLWDASGTTQLATAVTAVDASGQVSAQIAYPAKAGVSYLLEVGGVPAGVTSLSYSLSVQSLTEDLGTQVHASRSQALSAGDQFLYLITPAVVGSVDVTMTAPADFEVEQLSTDGKLTVLQQATGTGARLSIPVTATGQSLLFRVLAGNPGESGDFQIDLSNLDQYETSQNGLLFFPTSGGTPTALAAARLGSSGLLDLVTASANPTNPVNVLLNNGDGTFGASQGFAGGPGSAAGLRGLVVGQFTGSGPTDVAISNYEAGTVSVLLGNNNGTLQPPRTFGATALVDALATGDLNGDTFTDLVALQLLPTTRGSLSDVAVLFAQGDGNFAPPLLLPTTFFSGAGTVLVGDFSGHAAKNDHLLDIVALGFNQSDIDVFINHGKGVFTLEVEQAPEPVASALATDLNGDGNTDLVLGGTSSGNVYVLLGQGNGTFQAPETYFANTDPARTAASISGMALANFTRAGQANAPDDLVVTALPRLGSGSPQVVLLPALVDSSGHFTGFDSANRQQLALGLFAGPIVAANLASNGAPDVAVAVPGGVDVIYGNKPDTSHSAARDLGTVVHWVSPTHAIVPGHTETTFTLTVPTEAVPGAGLEVVDISARFQYLEGPGLGIEVTGPNNIDLKGENVDAAGQRFRVLAPSGSVLTVHVFGLSANGVTGSGAYNLDLEVAPQVVSVAAPSFLPDGSVTSLVITLQGDRLDASTAEVATNYLLTWLGPNGQTLDFVPSAIAGGQAVVYDPGANIDVATGRFYPTAVRQTITLYFGSPLPAGSYALAVSPDILAAPYNAAESGLLYDTPDIMGHALVALGGDPGHISDGGAYLLQDLVPTTSSAPPDFSSFATGTPFLQAFHDDLGALLDSQISTFGDSPQVTSALLAQAQAILGPGSTAPGEVPSFLVLALDPLSLNLVDSQNRRAVFDLKSNEVTNSQPKTYVQVGGNIEVVVVADPARTYALNVSDVNETARGGALILSPDGTQVISLTDALRAGVQDFSFDVPAALTVAGGTPAVVPPGIGPLAPGTAEAATAITVAQTNPAPATALAFTEAPVNEIGGGLATGGDTAGASATAVAAVSPSGGGGGVIPAGPGWLLNLVDQTFGPLGQVLADTGRKAVRDSSAVVGKAALDALESLGVPALVVPLRRAGEELLRSLFRGLGPGAVAPPPPPPADEDAPPPPAGDTPPPDQAAAEAPPLPPGEAPGKEGTLWLAAVLAGGLVPVWRQVTARKRRGRQPGSAQEFGSGDDDGESIV